MKIKLPAFILTVIPLIIFSCIQEPYIDVTVGEGNVVSFTSEEITDSEVNISTGFDDYTTIYALNSQNVTFDLQFPHPSTPPAPGSYPCSFFGANGYGTVDNNGDTQCTVTIEEFGDVDEPVSGTVSATVYKSPDLNNGIAANGSFYVIRRPDQVWNQVDYITVILNKKNVLLRW